MSKPKCPECKNSNKVQSETKQTVIIGSIIFFLSFVIPPLAILILPVFLFLIYKIYKEKKGKLKNYKCSKCKNQFQISTDNNGTLAKDIKTNKSDSKNKKEVPRIIKIILIGIGSFVFLVVLVAIPTIKNTTPEQFAQQKIEKQKSDLARKQEKEAQRVRKEKEISKQKFNKKLPEYEKLAGICSQTYIAALLAPKPADFPRKNATYDTERNLYRISSYVDSVNGFNAPARQRFYCEISGVDLDEFACQKHDCQWE